ncbi:MAG: UDP-N-acetylmuramate dehydrogenase [Acidimicrobiales bacterium]
MSLRELLEIGGARVHEHADVGSRTTYRVGGSVRALVTLATRKDFEELGPLIFSSALPTVVIGNGSNLLVADGEHEIIAVQMNGEFASLDWHDEHGAVVVEAGAGLDMPVAARRLASAGVIGFEWAVGVPGTFGGAVSMNAGGHGSDMAASVTRVRTYGPGGPRSWNREELGFGYRTSALSRSEIVTDVTLRLAHGDATSALGTIKEIVHWRRENQPGGQNGGSVFRNPEGDFAGRLIEAAQCKGLRYASAVVSEKHANFILVDPGGSANDVYALMATVRERVRASSGVDLVSEHRFVGFEDVA